MARPSEVTAILNKINDRDASAPDELLPLVYDELRKLAAGYMANERPDHTLQPTALVHDAYIRLVDWQNVSWQNRAHFFSVAAKVMRNILVSHAVAKRTQKRDFGQRIELTENVSMPGGRELDLFELDEALNALAETDPVHARIVELRFFGGLSIEETAHVLGVSPSTVKRDWVLAKTWLYVRLGGAAS
jgi:RNA polymerase sigma factor (TIGR02999 family)